MRFGWCLPFARRDSALNILVTGSAGFVGRELVPLLREAGHRVIGIDLDSEEHSDVFLHHDLAQPAELNSGPIDLCVHLAAAVGGILFNVERRDLVEVNDRINRSVVESCHRHGCRRMIFFSTINVFEGGGDFQHGPLQAMTDVSPYAASKVAGEQLFSEAFDDIVVVRPTNLFGKSQPRRHPRRGDSHVIPELLHKIETDPEIQVFGDGSQIRNFVHVSDICRFVMRNLDRGGVSHFNLRSEITITIRQLVAELLAFRGSHKPVTYSAEYMALERFQVPEFDMAAPKSAGWEARVTSIPEGLAL